MKRKLDGLIPEERYERNIAELELAIKTQTGQDWKRTDPLYENDQCWVWHQYQWPEHIFHSVPAGHARGGTVAQILDALRAGKLSLYRYV